eukprot:TRINITY_DN9090_c0_g1_i3.p1 TRINITY_DN9090_c0_g1~~TRINITY_DN9090_c0_g1_i3.p1  ORF type:complete len:208 (-),score=44.34 TRINITY_DN9090_c0_g1_i3:59-682(-)
MLGSILCEVKQLKLEREALTMQVKNLQKQLKESLPFAYFNPKDRRRSFQIAEDFKTIRKISPTTKHKIALCKPDLFRLQTAKFTWKIKIEQATGIFGIGICSRDGAKSRDCNFYFNKLMENRPIGTAAFFSNGMIWKVIEASAADLGDRTELFKQGDEVKLEFNMVRRRLKLSIDGRKHRINLFQFDEEDYVPCLICFEINLSLIHI